jgi:hypothetical protein
MGQLSRYRLAMLIAAVCLAATTACSHQSDLNNPGTQSGSAGIPFHQNAQTNDSSAADATTPDQNNNQSAKALPFNNTKFQDLPAGTLLTVRLETALTSVKPDSTGTFAAVLDEPIVIEGKTIVARGANVLGRIESARASEIKRNTGYLRLTLDSIHIQGKDLHLQTSSLFARGNVHNMPALQKSNNQPRIIDLQKGRRLTFRLTETLSPFG